MNSTDSYCTTDPGASISSSPNCGGTLLFMTILQGLISQNCNITDPYNRVLGIPEPESNYYDFIVVGGGTAGAVVAGRLSESGTYSVLLLEAGGPDPVASRIPGFYGNFQNNNETDWMYRTQNQEGVCTTNNGTGCSWQRGKTLGGCSVLNGMMYHRGHAADYDDWVEFGAEGWSADENQQYFDKFEDNKQIGTLVSSDHHSSGGPMPIQQFNYIQDAEYDLLEAVNATGIPIVSDITDPDTPEGVAIAQAYSYNSQRYTPARAYLVPETERSNLNILLHSHVTRVLFDGTQAIGVEYVLNGTTNTVYANNEVILSAGALNSPQILMLSGIGPKEDLENFNIEVISDLPVGRNLRNHVGVVVNFLLKNYNNTQILDWQAVEEYFANQTGVMASSGLMTTAFTYSSLGNKTRNQPDLQFIFAGFFAKCSSTGETGEPVDESYTNGRQFLIVAVSLQPRSIGYMTLNSTDPFDAPLFFPNYLNHTDDLTMLKDAVKIVKELSKTDILQTKYGIELDTSSSSVCDDVSEQWSDEWAECMIRTYTDAQNHQMGTAAISSVLDTDLRVLNVTGLRVIDASCMPTLVTGNIQAAVMMVAERGADMILTEYDSDVLGCEDSVKRK